MTSYIKHKDQKSWTKKDYYQAGFKYRIFIFDGKKNQQVSKTPEIAETISRLWRAPTKMCHFRLFSGKQKFPTVLFVF